MKVFSTTYLILSHREFKFEKEQEFKDAGKRLQHQQPVSGVRQRKTSTIVAPTPSLLAPPPNHPLTSMPTLRKVSLSSSATVRKFSHGKVEGFSEMANAGWRTAPVTGNSRSSRPSWPQLLPRVRNTSFRNLKQNLSYCHDGI